LHAGDTRDAASPKEDPIMSHHDAQSSATAMATNALAADTAGNGEQLMPPNSSISPEVRL
jgi:hypothetical protein